jgi:hypothetical protein
MTDEPSENEYCIEFDDQGRIVIKDLRVAERLLRSAARGEAVEIVIDATVLPNLTPNCGSIPPPPLPNGNGCPNGLCPLHGNIRFSQPALDRGLAEQWRDFRGEGE